MDLQSLYYFVELSKDLHMTRTANRLFISQQSLSNHIQRLEKHYGVPLLQRKPNLQLTLAGEEVLKYAELLGKETSNLTGILSDIKKKDRGVLRFGASTIRMNSCLDMISRFLSDHPNIELRLNNRFSRDLEKLVLNNELDLAFIFGFDGNPKLEELARFDDQLYLCVSDQLLRRIYGDETEELKQKAIRGARLEWFEKLPLCVLENRMGEQIRLCIEESGIRPYIFMTSTYTQACSKVCYQHLAACFMPQMSILYEADLIPEDINIFPIDFRGKPMVQQLSLICYRERYLSQYTRAFADRLTEHLQTLQRTEVARMVPSPSKTEP